LLIFLIYLICLFSLISNNSGKVLQKPDLRYNEQSGII
jgi:hypothetical protein